MFKKLRQHWNVNGLNLLLIICTFALGGSLCGYAGRKILLLLKLEKGAVWVMAYIVLVFLLWPLCVLLISIPMGQFSFFKRYIQKILRKFTGKHKARIAIFASGAGSNAREIIRHFRNSASVEVALVVCNKPGAGVFSVSAGAHIPSLLINRESFYQTGQCLAQLKKYRIEWVVLAGFLWKVPDQLIAAYPGKIVNIHPALLPKYGGKGMYGGFVHEAVIQNREKESGITIHLVDEQYDHGKILFQASCPVDEQDTPETLAQKIHQLEHAHYPSVIEKLLANG